MQKRIKPYLGTFVEIGFDFSRSKTFAKYQAVFDQVFLEIDTIQSLMSFQSSTSELTKLNQSCGEWVALNKATLSVLKLSQRLALVSKGLFNISIGGLLVKKGVLPDHNFGERLAIGSINCYQIAQQNVRLLEPVLLCVDGIAKGFAVDLAIKKLKLLGADKGWVNAGGDIAVFGDYSTPIYQKQSNGENKYIGHLSHGAVATSGSDMSPEHPSLLVNKEGMAINSARWTVIAKRAWRADALTKIASQDHSDVIVRRLGGRCIRN